MSDQTTVNGNDQQAGAAGEIPRRARQAAARGRQCAVSAARGPALALQAAIPTPSRSTARRCSITSPSPLSAAVSQASSPARGWSKPGCHRRPHRREGRRFRRHLVLESLSRRAMRHRLDGLHALARGNRAHAIGEIRARSGNPRAVPPHRPQVLALRQCAVPDRGDRHRMGRQRKALGDLDRSRRSFHRKLYRRRHRAAACAEAAGHIRHRDVQGPFLPHQPLGLRLHRRRCGRPRR